MNGGIIGKNVGYRRPPIGVFPIDEIALRSDLRYKLLSDLTSVSGLTHDDGLVATAVDPALFGGNSITWSKTTTSREWCAIKSLWSGSALNMNARKIRVYLYLTATAKSTLSDLYIGLGQDSSNKKVYRWAISTLLKGWNEIVIDVDTPSSSSGSPNMAAVNFLEVYFTTTVTAAVIGLNHIFIDAIFYR